MIPEKYIDTIRLIDFEKETSSNFQGKTIIVEPIEKETQNKNNEQNLNINDFYDKILPEEYNLSKFGQNKVAKFKYEGKITRKRLRNFLSKIQSNIQPHYYECNLNYLQKHSFHLNGFYFLPFCINIF